MTAECPSTVGRPFPLKIASSHGESGFPSNTWFPRPTRVLNPNGISIGSAVFAGLTGVTDRPIDGPRYSIGNNRRIYVRSTAMRPDTYGEVTSHIYGRNSYCV